MLNNKTVKAHIDNIDLNVHSKAHLFRAAQEGIAFAFRYGLDIMRENGVHPKVIRAGKANMFLSEVFAGCFAGTLNVPVEMYNSDGSAGAAIGAGLGTKVYSCTKEAFEHFRPIQVIEPGNQDNYNDFYNRWVAQLQKKIN